MLNLTWARDTAVASELPPLAVTAASALAAARANDSETANAADWDRAPQASAAAPAQASASARAVAEASDDPDADVEHPGVPRTETVTAARARATATATDSAEACAAVAQGQLVHWAKAWEVARATESLAWEPATAEEAAEQSATRCRADAQASRASREARCAVLGSILGHRNKEMWGQRDETRLMEAAWQGQWDCQVATPLGEALAVANSRQFSGFCACKYGFQCGNFTKNSTMLV